MAGGLARSRLSWWLRAPVGYTVLFTWLAWPLLPKLGTELPARPNPCDVQFITWVFSWVHHSLITAPHRLFDANIGYPAPGQLTGSEHFVSTQMAFAPLLWLTDNPVLATNLVAFLSYPAAAVAMERLLHALGHRGAVAWLAGLMFALGPLRVPFNVHVVQYLNLYLPLVALALVRLRDRPAARQAVLLAIVLAAGAFSSYYLALLLAVVAAVWTAWELLRPAPRRLRFTLLAAGAALVVLIALALFSGPYFSRPTSRTGPDVVVASGWWAGFKIVPWGLEGYPPPYQTLVAALGGLAMVARVPGTARAVVPGLLCVAIGTLLMYGFPTPLARLVVDSPLGFIQWPHRFAVVAGFGDALLLAASLQAIGWWAGAWAGWLATAAFAVTMVTRPALSLSGAEMRNVPALDGDRPVYEAVARVTRERGEGALLELPFIRGRAYPCPTAEADSMVGSTIHWLPLVGSYSGYQPLHRGLLLRLVGALPAPQALNDLIDMTHTRWILIRPAADWESQRQRTALVSGLMISPSLGVPIDLGVPGWTLLPVVREPKHPEWFQAIAAGWRPATTVLGTALGPIPEADAVGIIQGVNVPPHARAAGPYWLTVRVLNNGQAAWPGTPAPAKPITLAFNFESHVPDAYRTVLSSRWRSVETGVLTEPQERWLRRDLPAGEMLVQTLPIKAPPVPGTYELEMRLRQIDGPEFVGPGNEVLRATVSFTGPPAGG